MDIILKIEPLYPPSDAHTGLMSDLILLAASCAARQQSSEVTEPPVALAFGIASVDVPRITIFSIGTPSALEWGLKSSPGWKNGVNSDLIHRVRVI